MEKDNNEREKSSSFVIKIPSYDEVAESSRPKTTLFNSSQPSSFTQAFDFVKNTEFYTAPPPPPHSNTAPQPSQSTTPPPRFDTVQFIYLLLWCAFNGWCIIDWFYKWCCFRQPVGAEASPSTSVSAATKANKNCILVGQRQVSDWTIIFRYL